MKLDHSPIALAEPSLRKQHWLDARFPPRSVATVLLALLVGISYSAHAWNPFKAAENLAKDVYGAAKGVLQEVGSFVGAPVGGFVGAATAPTINQAESAGHRLLADVDGRLQARISEIDVAASNRIGQLDLTLERRIAQADAAVSNRIVQVDSVLAARIGQIDGVLGRSIADVDEVLANRLAQLDEIAEKRIGNIDVVATKASLTFEAGFLRILAMGCLMVFFASALWRITVEGGHQWRHLDAVKSLWPRLQATFVATWKRIVGQVALVGAALVVMYAAFALLPGGPSARAKTLARQHDAAFQASLRAFDLQRARYHAAQLQVIDPISPGHRVAGLKAEMIRDIFSRPAILQTPTGVNQVAQRVEQIERLAGVDRDPDILVIKAFVHWRVGSTRADEVQAAEFACLALERRGSEGFALEGLGQSILASYMHSPLPEALLAEASRNMLPRLRAQFARLPKAESRDEQSPFENANPLSYVARYNYLVQELDRASTQSYLKLVEAQAQIRAIQETNRLADLRTQRETARAGVTNAWLGFMQSLRDPAVFEGTAAPLAAFLLNDAVQMRAMSYQEGVTWSAGADVAPKCVALGADKRAEFGRVLLRVRIENEFSHLLPRMVRDVVDFQESGRFFDNEARLVEFETACVEFEKALTGAVAMRILTSALSAAEMAARLNLFDYRPESPQPYAMTILGRMESALQAAFLDSDNAKELVKTSKERIYSALIVRKGHFI